MEKKLTDALNGQLKEELFSAYLYMAMAADMEVKFWKGTSAWLKMQAQEEFAHAMKLYTFIIARGERAVLPAIEKPQESWDSIGAVFKDVLQHEQFITGCINKLIKVAREVDDNPADTLLQWYATEQVEEESSAEDVLQKLKMIGESPQMLFMLDKELGGRQQQA